METTKTPTIGELVKKDYRKAEVFKKYGIDFCCGGKKTVDKACSEKGIDANLVEKDLNDLESIIKLPSQDFNAWDADFLADYIINTHHKYVNQSIPVLFEYTQKVAKVHGERLPEVIEIADLFMEVMNELNCHMMKEENVLFPYIKNLAIAKKQGVAVALPGFGTVKNPINMMEHEHETVGQVYAKIRELTNNYTPPANACGTHRVSYYKLQEFEEDLHQHIHLENNILFPKAVDLEKELLG